MMPDKPSSEFDLSDPKWKEIKEVLRKARTSSAPGPNGIPYIVYYSNFLEANNNNLEARTHNRIMVTLGRHMDPRRGWSQ